MSRQSDLTAADRLLLWVIALACAGFVVVLGLAAYWDHSIVVLHAFQSLQYAAILLLAARRNRWGYFIAIAVGTFWNYLTLFVNNFVSSGWRALVASLHSGAISKPDQIIAVFGFGFHVVLVLAAAGAYLRLPRRSAGDVGRLMISVAGAIGYFAIIVALFQPRYLPMFSRLLHPHGFT